MIKCFLLNHVKKLAQIRAVVFEKSVKIVQLRCTTIPQKWRHRAKKFLKLVNDWSWPVMLLA